MNRLATKWLTLLALMFVATLAGLEISLHVFHKLRAGYWLPAGVQNFRVSYAAPVPDRRQYALLAGYEDDLYTINSDGFREPGVPDSFDDPLICVIGDSVPFGIGVRDTETFPFHLERALADLGVGAQVLNGGVPSYNLRQSLDRWRFDIAPNWGCAVVVLTAVNDVSLIHSFGTKHTPETTWVTRRVGDYRPPEWSAIAVYISRAMSKIDRLSPPPTDEDLEEARQRSLRGVEQDFNDGLDRIAEMHIPTVLLPVNPCYYFDRDLSDPSNSAACAGYTAFADIAGKWNLTILQINRMLRSAAERPGVTYLDTVKMFDRGRDGKFVDFIHLSDHGAREYADMIAQHLLENNLLPSRNR